MILRCAVFAVTVLLCDRHTFGDVVWDLSGQLHKAAQDGNAEQVRALLKANPELVSSIDIDTNTPLHLAVKFGHEDIVELLLKDGADINARNKSGETPLDLAITVNVDMAKLLIAHKADVNTRDKIGETPLDHAVVWGAIFGHTQMVDLLIANGADVTAKGTNGETPLFLTVEIVPAQPPDLTSATNRIAVQKDFVKLLLAHGADINAKDPAGYTPLHAAVSVENRDIVEFLLTKKADVNARDDKGETPLRLAIENTNDVVATILRQHGGRD